MGATMIAMYEKDRVPEFSLEISIVGVFMYCMAVMIHDIFSQSQDGSFRDERERRLNILGQVRFLTGAAAAIIILLILVPQFGLLLLVTEVMLLVKIGYNLDRPFFDFSTVTRRNNTSDPTSVASNNMEDRTEEQQLPPPSEVNGFGLVMHQNNSSDPSLLAPNPNNTEEKAEEEQLSPPQEVVLTIEDD